MKKKIIILIVTCLFLLPFIVKAESMKATDYIKKIADDNGGNITSDETIGNTGLAYDGTSDNNLRYVGSNPNNYVFFNDELWRIIGVMNNVENEDQSKQTKIKIIRKDYLGKYQWDYGYNWMNGNPPANNNWEESAIMKLFNSGYDNIEKNNSLYWNSQKGNCFFTNGSNTQCDFSNTGMKNKSKQMISKSKYYLGGSSTSGGGSQSTSSFYTIERSGNANPSYNSFWYGDIGLLYASDYGYATSGDNSTTRHDCISRGLGFSNWQNTACSSNDWLTNSSSNEWTITTTTNNVYSAHAVMKNGGISGIYFYPTSSSANYIRPVLYLDPDVLITSGAGTDSNPYVIIKLNYCNILINNDDTKGVISNLDNVNNVEESSVVSFDITPKEGYLVNEISIKDSNNESIIYVKNENTYSFIMPSSDATITPSYEKVSNAVNIEENQNTQEIVIEVNNSNTVTYEDTVKFTVTPKDGYKVDSIEIIDKNNNRIECNKTNNKNEYEFIMPSADVTIKLMYKKIDSINDQDTLKNPKTGDIQYIIILAMVIILASGTLLYSTKKSNNT